MIIHDIAATQCVPLAPILTRKLPLVVFTAHLSDHQAGALGLALIGEEARSNGLSELQRNTRHKCTAIVAIHRASAAVLRDSRLHLETFATTVARHPAR